MSIDTNTAHPTAGLPQQTRPEIHELRAVLMGTVHVPGEPGWDAARMPWAVSVSQQPLAVVEVADAHDVRRSVEWAVRHGHQVTAQPVGHGASRALAGNRMDRVLLLRTRALRDIDIDIPKGTVTVGAGVKVGELLEALEGTGLTFLAGSNSDPTVVGMTITGGMSWFGRAYGFAANAIASVQLVDAKGRSRTVTRTSDPELFWALRGGGGDFGIITALEIQLLPGFHLYGGRMLWPLEQMPEVLRAFREVTAHAPDQLTLWYHTYQFPPMPELPEEIRGKAFSSVAVAHLGSADEAEAQLAPLRAVPGMVMDLMGPVRMADLGHIAEEPTDPMPVMEHSMLLADLGDEVIDRLTCVAGAGSGSPLTVLQIRHLGGAFRRRSASHGACGHLDEPYLLFALGVPVSQEAGAAIAGSFDRLDLATEGHTDGRTVPNFLGSDGDLARAWYPATREPPSPRQGRGGSPPHRAQQSAGERLSGHDDCWTGPPPRRRPNDAAPGSAPGLPCGTGGRAQRGRGAGRCARTPARPGERCRAPGRRPARPCRAGAAGEQRRQPGELRTARRRGVG